MGSSDDSAKDLRPNSQVGCNNTMKALSSGGIAPFILNLMMEMNGLFIHQIPYLPGTQP